MSLAISGQHLSSRAIKVFICHASEDADQAWAVAGHLLDAGFAIWLDRFCIQPGQDWQHVVREGVRSSDVVLVLVSAASVSKTGFLQREVKLVLEQADMRPEGAVFILPLVLDGTKPPSSMERLQWVSAQQADWMNVLRGALRANARPPASRIGSAAFGPPEISLVRVHLEKKPATVDYIIDLLDANAAQVTLGASLLSRSGDEFFDVRLDREVVLTRGVAMYRRGCPRPAILRRKGVKLVAAAWWQGIGAGGVPLAVQTYLADEGH
ncbi:toll/interleukin-1 receptor domain-containing protein [Modestobacter sp. VKM Ac-2984]|uniref:toll/interleukin-1 receptor domain-containing protein n=1 Tax=Modestobacter sp. VKM Ac-2984 TaxID=3004138 RepID=UPI0022AB02BB|nr:toll/interleukin-1 receptor domain-containing protein [Modestobacter sp. VKM Ac-2984]MCZ2814738.1 toll/interleukin-1 receptor domain-containing protein [Modestobacter sp. VKM Ac-2984]